MCRFFRSVFDLQQNGRQAAVDRRQAGDYEQRDTHVMKVFAEVVMPIRRLGFASFAALGLLAACGTGDTEQQYPDDFKRGDPYRTLEDEPSVFGEGGFSIGGESESGGQEAIGGGGLGVNGFLWRASLDTISFMPVNSADPFGGVIITDWHAMPETPDERFKMNVYILGRALRADGVRVAVFRQARDPQQADWVDVPVGDETAEKIEDAILVRARQLRFAALQQ